MSKAFSLLDKEKEGTMGLSEAYTRGLLLLLVAVGSVFAYQFMVDLYRQAVHPQK
jgi:hypothetical protein